MNNIEAMVTGTSTNDGTSNAGTSNVGTSNSSSSSNRGGGGLAGTSSNGNSINRRGQFKRLRRELANLVDLDYNFLNGYIPTSCDILDEFNKQCALIVCLEDCTSREVVPNSFAQKINNKFNYAHPFKTRSCGPYPNVACTHYRGLPGSVRFESPPTGVSGPSFVFMYGQIKPGDSDSNLYIDAPQVDSDYVTMCRELDTNSYRLRYFEMGLIQILHTVLNYPGLTEIIFPRLIGCRPTVRIVNGEPVTGMWPDYSIAIENFALELEKFRPNTTVYVADDLF